MGEWAKIDFLEVIRDETKLAVKIKKEDYLQQGDIPIIDQGKKYIAGYANNKEGVYKNNPVIIFGDHTRNIKYFDRPFFIGADGVKVLKVELNKANTKFVFYYLKTCYIEDTGYNRHFKWLKEFKIPIPSMEMQGQIVKALDQAKLLIEKRKLQIEKLDLLIKSQFVEMFGNPAVNSKKWEEKKLKECLVNIESGKSFVCDSKRRTGNNVAMLKLSAVTYGKYDSTENKAILEEKMFVSKAEVKKGDLLFTRKNTPELVGMSAFVYSTPPKLMMPDLIFRLNTNEKCNRVYLWTLINLDEFRHRVTGLASGSAKSMSNISKERLSNLVLPVPPIELQTQFADFVNKVEKTKATLQQSLNKMEQNYKSLMQKCFRGEIF